VQVEAFEGVMRDVRASHGVLVCPFGHTKAAYRRAQDSIDIHLVPLSFLERFDPTKWDRCCKSKCSGFIFWDGYPEITLCLSRAEAIDGTSDRRLPYVHAVGKCEQCRRFHVKCFTCAEIFWMGDESEHQCNCKPPWFWLSSIERDEEGRPSAELHAVTLTNVVTFNRRSL